MFYNSFSSQWKVEYTKWFEAVQRSSFTNPTHFYSLGIFCGQKTKKKRRRYSHATAHSPVMWWGDQTPSDHCKFAASSLSTNNNHIKLPHDVCVKKCEDCTISFPMRSPLPMWPNALSNLGVGGFGSNRTKPFGLSSLALAAAGTLALTSVLHNHTHKQICILK